MDEKAALIKRIKRLVIDCTPHIRDVQTVEEVQNVFLHLEETNKDFHKYPFVKYLRSRIEKMLGPLIEAELERYGNERTCPTPKQENPDVTSITNKVLNSSEYRDLSERIRNEVSGACNSILEDFQREFFMSGSEMTLSGYPTGREIGRHSRRYGSDAESSTFENSLSQSAVIFMMNQEQQKEVACNLERHNSIETRRDAINELLRVTSFDISTCSVWPHIRAGLIGGLVDDHEDLCTPCLRFVARGLSANSASSREMYILLVEFLQSQFNAQRQTYLHAKDGLDITLPYIKKLLRSFHLLNSFQQLVPQYWQRNLEGCLEKLLTPTMSLLAKYAECSHPAASSLTPLHFLALVDCEAKWFVHTMHGHSSRSQLLQILENTEYRPFAQSAAMVCFNFLSSSVSSSDDVDHYSSTQNHSPVFFRAEEIKFAHFVHCLCIVRRLIIYEQGRSFFPVECDGKTVSLTQLLEVLLQFVTHDSSLHHRRCVLPEVDKFNPCLLIMDMMKELCTSEDVCQKTVCKDRLIKVLMKPISTWLDSSKSIGRVDKVSDVVLAHVAEILSCIASTRCGQRVLLYGENCSWQSSVTGSLTAVHMLAEFAQKALKDEFLPRRVVGSLIFVCRQLYSTCEGLLQLSHHKLHHSLTAAWKSANRDGDCPTPTPSIEWSGEMHQTDIWEDMLQDDLLNFAATPKGVLLLEQTGAMYECVSYMYSRYARKLQVSSCEKFGYGYMMSQIAATAPGIAAMDKTGFTCALIRALWNAVETLDEGALPVPRFWPASPVEKAAKKPFMNIVNLLSSFRSVFEVIGLQATPPPKEEYSHRQGPTTVIDLLDRLTFVDSSAKVLSLFNYEDSHVFGLRLLSVLSSCLDTALLLQTKYKFQEMLLHAQSANINEAANVDLTSKISLDMLSLERNYILVKTFLVGGPSERNLPPRTLQIGKNEFVYKLFSSYPVPRMYSVDHAQKSSRSSGSECAKFLSNPDSKQSWLDKASKLLVLELTGRKDDLSLDVCMQLMERAVDVRCQNTTEAVFPSISSSEPPSSAMRADSSSMQLLGATVTVRYGCYLKLLTNETEHREQLCQLLKKCQHGLQLQQFGPSKSELKCVCNDRDVGFDWFLATTFLMASGNAARTYKFLSNFSSLLSSAFLWTQRTHCTKLLPRSFVSSGILPLYSVVCHDVELILQLELPHVYSAFRMSGCSAAQICQQWLNQCFWNYLDWPQIYQYMTACVVLGADYQVYICIAILHHLQHELMQQMQDKNLLIFLKEEPVRQFRIQDHLDYMQRLQMKYSSTVLGEMHGICKEP